MKLEFDHHTLAVDVFDHYIFWRLEDILSDVESVPEMQDVAEACRTMLGFMKVMND